MGWPPPPLASCAGTQAGARELPTAWAPLLTTLGSPQAALEHCLSIHSSTCSCEKEDQHLINASWNRNKMIFYTLSQESGLPWEEFLHRTVQLLTNSDLKKLPTYPTNPSVSTYPLKSTSTAATVYPQKPSVSTATYPNKCLSVYPTNKSASSYPNKSTTQFIDKSSSSYTNKSSSVYTGKSISSFVDKSSSGYAEKSSSSYSGKYPGKRLQGQDYPAFTAHGKEKAPEEGPAGCLEDLEEINHLIANDLSRTQDPPPPKGAALVGEGQPPGGPYSHHSLQEEEKHMAPIECSGVPRAAGHRWFCKLCQAVHRGREDCSFYLPFHQPLASVPNSSATDGLPHMLALTSDGVRTKVPVKAYTRFGPLLAREVGEEQLDFDEDRTRVHLLHTESGGRRVLLAGAPHPANWVRDVRPAATPQQATALTISHRDRLYLVTAADLAPGGELTFYSREDPTTEFWTSWTEAWCNQTRCSRCAVQFESVADYRTHIAIWHDTSFQGNPQNRIYFCPDCGLKKVGAKEIVSHCRQEHRQLAFPCRHCNRRFESYNSLIKHKKRLHAPHKVVHRCDQCGKSYSDGKALKAHIQSIHKRSAELHCSQCERIFSSKYALNRHRNEVHARLVQHTCEQCGKQFAQFSNLKIHWRTHSGVKPFQCGHDPSLCRVAFTTKQCLQVHYRKVHGYTDLTMPRIPSSVPAPPPARPAT